ncbi:hypothetical protein KP509_14G094400 [Ceratopteris richardii]|uniref:Chromo domain-containing protein n=1 Tax=Ceratopteris richardii TaxID=49495 RepID=A0A8T2THM4_CERRI|nr:hypothetical protein KP509_14G094400 [Ceratopteris richardii]
MYDPLFYGKCTKLSSRFCGPWKIVKKLSDVAYSLELPPNCKVDLVFHVSKLKKYISREENLIEDHSLDRILDWRYKRLRNRVIEEYLLAWRGLPFIDSTWESEALVRN